MRRKRKNRRARVLFLAVLLILGVYFGKIFIGQIRQGMEIEAKKQEELQLISDLNEDIAVLEDQYNRRESMEFAEQVARERFGMIKTNEKIVEDKGSSKSE